MENLVYFEFFQILQLDQFPVFSVSIPIKIVIPILRQLRLTSVSQKIQPLLYKFYLQTLVLLHHRFIDRFLVAYEYSH